MVFLFRVLRWLPLPVLHGLGALAGWGVYWASPSYRRHLNENLVKAVGAAQARRLRCAAVMHAGRMVMELPAVWGRPLDAALGLVRAVRGKEHLDAAQARGGVIVITPHLGCFEMIGQYCAARGPMTALYRPPRKAALEPLMRAGRERGHMQLAPADVSGVRRVLRALKNGETVGLLPDQAPGTGEGVWADFFGQPAYTMTLAARLSAQPGVTPLLLWAQRLACGRGFEVHIAPLFKPLEGPLEARVAQLNHELEALILRCPEQYLWGYNRYKVPEGVSPPC